MQTRLILFFLSLCSTLLLGQTPDSVAPLLSSLLTDFPSVRDFTISATGDEAYFTAQSTLGELSVIMRIDKHRKKWKTPGIASFSGTYSDMEPFLSPGELRLYFASNRPLNTTSADTKDYDLWYVERESRDAQWSAPINLGSPVNSEQNEFYPSLTTSGNLYFTSDRPGSRGKDDIFYSAFKAGEYELPISLGESVNSEGYDFNAFVSADESYLLFTGYNREDGLGSGDLYLSFRNQQGEWSQAKNLGAEINSRQMDYCPFVDGKSGVLYFTSRRSNVESKAGGFKSTTSFLAEINKHGNGQSRLYQIPAKTILVKE